MLHENFLLNCSKARFNGGSIDPRPTMEVISQCNSAKPSSSWDEQGAASDLAELLHLHYTKYTEIRI